MNENIIKNSILDELQKLVILLEILPTQTMIAELSKLYSNTDIDYVKGIKDTVNRMKNMFEYKIYEIQNGNDETVSTTIKSLVSISRMIDGLGSNDPSIYWQLAEIENKIYTSSEKYIEIKNL